MSFVEQLPENLKKPGKKEELIKYLNSLPVRFHVKKYTLIEWAELTGEKITREDVEKLEGVF